MSWEPRRPPLQALLEAAATQVMRRPYLSLSVAAHVALLGVLYYFGSYQLALRDQDAEVASSLRATGQASTAKRLQDLQTIKQLMEKSADGSRTPPEPGPATTAAPQTPEEMLAQARELSEAIETLDKKIKADELAALTGTPKPQAASPPADPPATAPSAAAPQAPAATASSANDGAMAAPEAAAASASAGTQPQAGASATVGLAEAGKPGDGKGGAGAAPVTPEQAANEVASLEAKARATLAKRQQRLEAKANGVQVAGSKHDKGGGSDAARAEIADFIGARDRTEQALRSTSYAGWNRQFFGQGQHQIPPVDAKSLVLGRGRMLGAGGEYANRVYLNSWYVIGPFPGRHEGGLFDNPSYPPENAVLLDAVYYGKDKRLLKWRYVTAQSYPFLPPDQAEDSVYYGYTEVFVDQARDLIAWIGADDDLQVHLNDRLVWQGGNVSKATYFDAIFNGGPSYMREYNRTEGKRLLHFNKGRNKLFFKLSNGPNGAFVSIVLTEATAGLHP